MGLISSGIRHQPHSSAEPVVNMSTPANLSQTMSSEVNSSISNNNNHYPSGYTSEKTPSARKDSEILQNMDWNMHILPDDDIVQKSCNSESSSEKTPVVFRWPPLGKKVYVAGSYDGWKEKTPLTRSESGFCTILEVPHGTHQYKFLVDGQWTCNPMEHESGSANNVVTIKSSDCDVFAALDFDSVGRSSEQRNCIPPGKWSQDIPPQTASNFGLLRSRPPCLPPHLLDTILNKETPSHCEPNMLPEPSHVVLNHLYTKSINDGVVILGVTHRYRKKYITTLLYRPT